MQFAAAAWADGGLKLLSEAEPSQATLSTINDIRQQLKEKHVQDKAEHAAMNLIAFIRLCSALSRGNVAGAPSWTGHGSPEVGS